MPADLARVLEHNIDEYLVKDIESMKRVPAPPPGQKGGGVGYPLVMSVFSGIELLGALTSLKKFQINGKDKTKSSESFRRYWQTYLYKKDVQRREAADSIYSLVRNSIAHSFSLKGGVSISRGRADLHLKRDPANQNHYLDAFQLADDFVASYRDQIQNGVLKATSGATKASMSLRLNEMHDAYDKLLGRQTLSLPTPMLPPPILSIAPAISDFSGSYGAVSTPAGVFGASGLAPKK